MKKLLQFILSFFSFIITLLLFNSCNSCNTPCEDTSRGEFKALTTELDSIFVNTCNDTAIVERKFPLENINIFLQTSHGMAGYLNHLSDFNEIVNDLIGQIAVLYGTTIINSYGIDSDLVKYESVEDFTSDLNHYKVAIGTSSPLDEILDTIIQKTNENSVSIFLSNGIMSGTNEQIQSNEEFNRSNRRPLSLKVLESFNIAKDSNFICDLYMFTSTFVAKSNTPYFNYRNNRIIGNFDRRPFYLFIIGNKRQINKLNIFSELPETNKITFLNKESFGRSEGSFERFKPWVYNNFLPINERNCTVISDYILDINDGANNVFKFLISLNNEALPSYANNKEYLENNLIVSNNDYDFTPTILSKREIETLINQSNMPPVRISKEISELRSNSSELFALISINERVYDDSLKISLLNNKPIWYLDYTEGGYSTDDDSNILENDTVTFLLEDLIWGIENAYNSNNSTINKNIFTHSIKINY